MAAFDLFLLVLFLFTSSFQPSVEPDDALMDHLCGNTEEPVICSDCLKSDPTSKTADGRGLALVAVRCAERDTAFMYNTIFKLSQNASVGPAPLREVLEDCAWSTFDASQDFSAVSRFVEGGDYGSAKQIISESIMPGVNGCLKQFNRYPRLPVPSEVLSGTLAVNQDCKFVTQILTHLNVMLRPSVVF